MAAVVTCFLFWIQTAPGLVETRLNFFSKPASLENAGGAEVLHLSGSGSDTEMVDSSYYQWDTYFGSGGSGVHRADNASGGGDTEVWRDDD
jgi:hypothetical protein